LALQFFITDKPERETPRGYLRSSPSPLPSPYYFYLCGSQSDFPRSEPPFMDKRNPFSLIDSAPSLLSTRAAKRIFRLVWVLAANACVSWLMFTRLRSVGFPAALDFQLCFEFVVEVILPVVGIVLAVVNWKFARWVNVGCLTVAGCFWLAESIWWRSDPFFGVLLIVALGLLVIAGLTEIVYRTTKNDLSS
jgi:hypothetical protein